MYIKKYVSHDTVLILLEWECTFAFSINKYINKFVIVHFRMFESRPELMELFSDFRGQGLSDIKKTGLLRHHALRVMATIDKCITRIGEPDDFIELLTEVGIAHRKYNVPTGFFQVTNATLFQHYTIVSVVKDGSTKEGDTHTQLISSNIAI